MNNSINRTSSAQAMENSSILQTMIPSTTTQGVGLPCGNNLAAGKYYSRKIKLTVQDKEVGADAY